MNAPRRRVRFGGLFALIALFASVTVASAAPPANDDFADATAMLEGVEQRADNTEATEEVDEDYCDEGPTVYWKFTATEAGDYLAYATGSNTDTEIGINDAVDNNVGECPDDESSSYDAVEDPWTMAVDDEIWVQVGQHDADSRGTVGAGIALIREGRDNFEFRRTLSFRPGAPSAVAGFSTDGTDTVETGEPVTCGAETMVETIWYSFTPPTTGAWLIEVKTVDDYELAVYEGSALDSLTPLNCAFDSGQTRVAVDLVAGREYAIQIEGDGGSAADGVLRAEFANDIRGMSQVIDDADGEVGDNSAATLFDDGRPAVFYDVSDSGMTDFVYAERSADGVWTRDPVVEDLASTDSTWVDIGVLPNGNPVVSWHDPVTGDLMFAERSGGTWTTVTVDDAGTDAGEPHAMVTRSDGSVNIAYKADDGGQHLRLATRTPGGVWSDASVDTDGSGGGTDLADHVDMIVYDGALAIAASEGTNDEMLVYMQDGGSWDESVVRSFFTWDGPGDSTGADGNPSLNVSPDGTLKVAVQDDDIGHSWIATWDGSSWSWEIIMSDRLIAELGWASSIDLLWDHDGRAIVVWQDDNYGGAVGVSVYEDGVWHEQVSTSRLANPFTASGYHDTFADQMEAIQMPDGRLAWTVPHNDTDALYWAEDMYRVCPSADTPLGDVPGTSFASEDVKCIYGLGITTGTSPTEYSPADFVTREQMAAFLARLYRQLTGDECTGHSHPFTDVPGTSFAAEDVGCIFFLGVTTGTSDTTYSPADFVTREQMASFLARLYRAVIDDTCSGGTHPFTDISATSFAKDDIPCIFGLKITTGTSPGFYSPADDVTREQMAAFLGRFWRTKAIFPS